MYHIRNLNLCYRERVEQEDIQEAVIRVKCLKRNAEPLQSEPTFSLGPVLHDTVEEEVIPCLREALIMKHCTSLWETVEEIEVDREESVEISDVPGLQKISNTTMKPKLQQCVVLQMPVLEEEEKGEDNEEEHEDEEEKEEEKEEERGEKGTQTPDSKCEISLAVRHPCPHRCCSRNKRKCRGSKREMINVENFWDSIEELKKSLDVDIRHCESVKTKETKEEGVKIEHAGEITSRIEIV